MANHKVVGARRGSPIFKGADLLVCAAQPDVEDTKFHLVGFSHTGNFMLDDPDLFGSWKNCHCFHLFDDSFPFRLESSCCVKIDLARTTCAGQCSLRCNKTRRGGISRARSSASACAPDELEPLLPA